MSESPDTPSSGTSRAEDLKQRIKQDSRQRIDSGKRTAADQMSNIADAIDDASARLDESQPTLASYASKLAGGIGDIATHLREDSIEDLYRDARRIATDHPGMFLLGGAALGLAIARFMKAESVEGGMERRSERSEAGLGETEFGAGAGIERSQRRDRPSGSATGV